MRMDNRVHFSVICSDLGWYGLTVCDKNGNEILRCSDITADKDKLFNFADTCNRCGVSAVHIMDLIEDFLE